MARPASRNNIIAGVFVLASLVLAVFISALISDVQKYLVPTNAFTVRFSIADGAAGLKPGSPVHVGGQEVGRVTAIDFERPAPGDMPTGVLVRVVVNRAVAVADDAMVFLERPLLGSMSTINIIRPSSPAAAAQPLQPGSTLQGVIAPPSFLAQAGFGPEQSKQVQNIVSRASEVADRVDRLSLSLERDLDPTLKSLRTASDDVVDITQRFRQRTPDWITQTDELLAGANRATKDAQDAMASIRAAVEENRPAIDRAIQNIEKTTADVNATSVPMLNDMLAAGRTRFEELRAPLSDVASLIREEEPNIRRALANFRLASDQIKLATVEIRRSPWRLLYSPKAKELDSELFYDAARTYAEAVSDLRAVSEALESSTRGDGMAPASATVDRQTIEQLLARLAEAFAKYDQAERALLQKMTDGQR